MIRGPTVILLTLDELRSVLREVVREELSRTHPDGRREVLTRGQAAQILGVHPVMVARYAKTGGLRGAKIGRTWRFLRSDVIAWLEFQAKR